MSLGAKCTVWPSRLRSGSGFAYHCPALWANSVRAVRVHTGILGRQSEFALWRRILSAFVFLSFLSISYASQTHIHGLTIAQVAASTFAKSLHASGNQLVSKPIKNTSDDSADCPLCQAASLTGVAILPFLITVLLLQNITSSVLPLWPERFRPSRLRFARQTRGPPTL